MGFQRVWSEQSRAALGIGSTALMAIQKQNIRIIQQNAFQLDRGARAHERSPIATFGAVGVYRLSHLIHAPFDFLVQRRQEVLTLDSIVLGFEMKFHPPATNL